MDPQQPRPFDPDTIPSPAFHSYLRALEHLAPGLVKVSPGEAMHLPLLPTEENPRVTLPFKDAGIYVSVTVEQPLQSPASRAQPMWRLPSICGMLRAMRENIGDAPRPCEAWPAEVDAVWKAIIERNGEAISLNELAAERKLSEGYLGERVARFLGSSFRHLLAEERVALAARQLVTTNRRIEDIAKGLGLSLSQFNRNFASSTGMAPREYRKRTEVPKKVFRR